MSQQYNESQGYNADLQGATSTDAEQQSLVEQPVVIDEDLPTDAEVAEEAAADSETVPAADEDAPVAEDTDEADADEDAPVEAEADEAGEAPPTSSRRPSTRSRSSATRCARKIGDWFVVHTYSGMENRVKANLENRITSLNMEDYIHEVIVPTEEVAEIKNGQRKLVKRTVLPGYVLVRMDLTDESWAAVRHTPSVTGFVGHSHQPVPLSLDEVESMLAPAVLAAGRGRRARADRWRRRPPPRRRSRSPTSTCPTRSWSSTVRSPRCTRRSPRSTPSPRGSRPSSRSSAGRPRSS